jgi:DNA-binding response OmpR family regulator
MPLKSKVKTILIIEDGADLRQFINWVLQAEGYNTIEAADGEEGLKKARQNHVDVIILDIRLPYLFGWDVLRDIKNIPELFKIPVVVCTASTDPIIKSQAIEMGATDYLVKPIKVAILKKSITDALKKSKGK